MLDSGVYPASVTPLNEQGRVDMPGVARLLAWFEACGCKGAVLAATNGEGPSLSAVEKRDLIRDAMPLRGKLDLILGIATPSLHEAIWLTKQAANGGASAVLVMAPFYFREASEAGIEAWFLELMSKSPSPVLVYNFPKMTGVTISPELMRRLSQHERFAGLKDSSGSRDNLTGYADAVKAHSDARLFVGNEELLIEAMDAGWTGTISGAANAIPMWLSQVVHEYSTLSREQVQAKFELILPAILAIRSYRQPAMNKAILHRLGVLPRPDVRPPLVPPAQEEVKALAGLLSERLGLRFGDPSLNVPAEMVAG